MRRFLIAAGCALLSTWVDAIAQQAYPAQPIRFVVTTAPGGGLDSFARVLAKELTPRAGHQVIVDNRAGAGTTIGTAAVARAKPDGYTVLLNTAAFAIGPAIYTKLPYDTLRDFAPITMAASAPNLMVVHPSVPVRSVRDMIALAKARAGRGDPILYASGGNGTNGHLATALFMNAAQIRMVHVPYKSGSLAVVDVIAGQVPMLMDTISSVMPHVATGKLRALGVSSPRRAAAAPGLPTIAEAGVPGYESAQWYGLWAPAGTPQEIVSWLHRETAGVLQSVAMKERLTAEGLEIIASSPENFATFIRSDVEKWTKLVKSIGMSLM